MKIEHIGSPHVSQSKMQPHLHIYVDDINSISRRHITNINSLYNSKLFNLLTINEYKYLTDLFKHGCLNYIEVKDINERNINDYRRKYKTVGVDL